MNAKFAGLALAVLLSALAFPIDSAVAEDKKILMALWRGNTASERAFKARLAELGIKVTYTEIDAGQDRRQMAAVMRPLQGDIAARKFDLIYAYGSVGTQLAITVAEGRAPIIFNIVFDPTGNNFVGSMEAPGGNVTGVTNGVPIADQLNAFVKLGPIKTLLVPFNTRELNSQNIERQVEDWGEVNNVTVMSRRLASEGDSLAAMIDEIRSGKLSVDALYAGADSFLGSKAAEINAAVGDKVKLYGGTETFVSAGWLMTYAPAVKDMGIAAADLAARIMAGENPATIPVILPPPKLYISRNAAITHGVEPPPDAILEK